MRILFSLVLFVSFAVSAQPYTSSVEEQRLISLGMTPELSVEITNFIDGGGIYQPKLANNTYLQGLSAAGAAISLLKVDATDDTVLNADSGDTIKLAVAGSTVATVSSTAIAGTGEITSSSTGSLGWSYVTGANTACTTTCTSAAVFGVDLAAGASQPVIVGPSAATADACVCAGAS